MRSPNNTQVKGVALEVLETTNQPTNQPIIMEIINKAMYFIKAFHKKQCLLGIFTLTLSALWHTHLFYIVKDL